MKTIPEILHTPLKHGTWIMALVLVGAIGAIAILEYTHRRPSLRTRELSTIDSMRRIRQACEAYRLARGAFPASVADLRAANFLEYHTTTARGRELEMREEARFRLNPKALSPQEWSVAYVWPKDVPYPGFPGKVSLLFVDGSFTMVDEAEFDRVN